MKIFRRISFALIIYLQVVGYCQAQIDKSIDSLKQTWQARKYDTVYVYKFIKLINSKLQNKSDTTNLNLWEIRQLSEQLNYHNGLYFVYSYLAEFYYVKGNYAKSIVNEEMALKYAKIMNNKQLIGNALLQLGESTDKSGDYHTAKKYVTDAFSIFNATNDVKNIPKCFLKFAFISFDLKQYDSCLIYSQKAAKQFFTNKDYESYISACLMTGGAYTFMKQYKKAQECVFDAWNTCEKYQVKFDKSELLMGLTHAYYYDGKYNEAIVYGKMAIALSAKDSILRHLWLCSDIVSKSYFETKDFKNAYLYLDSAKEYQFKLFNKEKINYVNELNTKYFTKQREAENLLLKEKSLSDAKLLKQKNLLLILGLFGTVSILALLVVVVVSRKRVMKTNLILSQQKQKIENQKEEISTQLDIQKKQKEEIETVNLKLTDLLGFQNRLIFIVSHDLRSPFTNLLLMTEEIVKNFKAISEDKLIANIQIINKSSQKAFKLVNDLLVWMQSHASLKDIVRGQVNVHKVVTEVLDNFIDAIAEKHLLTKISINEAHTIFVDHNMFRTIVRNIIANAVKFNKNGGKLIITSCQNNENIEISIQDTGTGMLKSDVNKLFTFQSREINAAEKGSSLGLVICKEFAEKNGGNITVQSTVNEGSIFTIHLPAYKQPNEAKVAINQFDNKVLLSDYLKQLSGIEFYENSKIRKILNEIKKLNIKELEYWTAKTYNAVLTSNEEEYQKLVAEFETIVQNC